MGIKPPKFALLGHLLVRKLVYRVLALVITIEPGGAEIITVQVRLSVLR